MSIVWGMSVFCEVWACEVRGLSMRLEVRGWRSKVWGWRSLCQVEGMRFEAFYKVKGQRCELKVEGMKSTVYVSSQTSRINNLKGETLYQKLEVSLCNVKGQRFYEGGGMNFKCYLCEVQGLRLKHFVWGLTSEHSLWGSNIHCSLWNLKFEHSWFFVKFKV